MEIFGNALAHIVNVEVSHPAIVAPLAAGLEAGTPFMAYEYVASESLDVALRRDARPAEALQWIALLAGAVDAAHARGLEHGALHLRDVLVSSDGVCATGFGIARALEHVRIDVPVRRPYAAPEMMTRRRWGPPADRFALAALAYELLTGTRPSGNSDDAIADLLELRPDVADPAGFQQAFRNALADDPAIRSASATAFATALARAIGDEALDGVPSPGGGEPVMDDGAGSPEYTTDALHGVGTGDVGPEDGDAAFGAQEFEEPLGHQPVGSGEPSQPVQISFPDDAVVPLEERSRGREGGDGEAGEARKEQPPRSGRTSRSKRRPRQGGVRRRTGPVVAVRDDVHFDPLDDPGSIAPAVGRAEYDEDVPPPPSPTSMRAIAPVIAAVAVGVLLAYLVYTGLGTSSDGTTGGAPPSSASAVAGVESTEERVVRTGEQRPASTAGGPLTLVDEPIVTVGDPPSPDAESIAAVDPPAPAVPTSDGGTPTAGAQRATPVAAPPPAPEPPPARLRPNPAVNEEPARLAETGAGSLLVRSRPPGATVRVDDVAVGVTPVEVPDVAFGTHLVRIELPGYRPWVTEVDVAGAEQVRVGASLEPGGRR